MYIRTYCKWCLNNWKNLQGKCKIHYLQIQLYTNLFHFFFFSLSFRQRKAHKKKFMAIMYIFMFTFLFFDHFTFIQAEEFSMQVTSEMHLQNLSSSIHKGMSNTRAGAGPKYPSFTWFFHAFRRRSRSWAFQLPTQIMNFCYEGSNSRRSLWSLLPDDIVCKPRGLYCLDCENHEEQQNKNMKSTHIWIWCLD